MENCLLSAVVHWLLATLTLCPGAFYQQELVARGPRIARVSEPLTLTCADYKVKMTTWRYYWYWYQQLPGKEKEEVAWIYPYDGNKKYTSSFQNRVTISSGTSKNEVSLQLVSPTAADSATYYCARCYYRATMAQLLASGPSTVKVSEPLTLTCAVTGKLITTTGFRGHWYRQLHGKGPEWMGVIDGTGGTQYAPPLQNRIKISRDTAKNQFSLSLLSVTAADTAKYYCALGTTQQPLIFGKGTLLTVEPQSDPKPPSVLLMKSKVISGNQVKAACLAKDFYPKKVTMNFEGRSDIYKQDDPVLSQNGKYNTIRVVQINSTEKVACSVHYRGQLYNATEEKPAAEKPMPTTLCDPSNSNAAVLLTEENPEKVNMLSITVLGLRVLLAKTIAFNTLMTIKLFVF